jgi:OOP family OmpA-OmpF porin
MKQGDVRFEDLALSISGEAEDPAAFKSLNAAVRTGLPKGIKLANANITAAVVSPFTWLVQSAGGQLVLAGHVAGGESARAGLVAAARVASPGVNVVDRMEHAEGAPPGWAIAAAAVMKELVRLENGTAEMKDAVFTVSGVAPDEGQAQAVRAALRSALPPAFKLTDQIRVREAAKAPEKAPEPVPPQPTPKQSESVPPLPAEPLPKSATAPPLPPAGTAPKQTPPMSPPSAPAPVQTAPTPKGPAEAAPQQAAPAPPSPAPKQAAPAQPSAPAEPPPKTAVAPPMPPPAVPKAVSACQENLGRIASAGHVLFATDSATLDTASYETLDRLAVAAKTCPGMRIAIEGHTDAEGATDYNQRLSVRRARAVVAYLIKAGADRMQLEAVGYGVTRPAVPNDTPQNMAKNRRIEFSVRQQ